MKLNKIYNMDCLEGMKMLDDNSIDIVITDPPYGVRKKEEWDEENHFKKTLEKWLKESYRVSKKGILWFCADKMIPLILRKSKNNNIDFHRILVWNKPPGTQFAGAQHNKIWYSIEPILVFDKNNKIKQNKDIDYSYASFTYRTIPQKKYNHPTTKPLGLIEELIKHYSDEGEIILDPFMGSGTTAVAALKNKRKFLGYELSRQHYNTALKRIGKFDKSYYDELPEEEKPAQQQLF